MSAFMSRRERRPITLFDLMMLVAATAVGLSLVQFGWPPKGRPEPGSLPGVIPGVRHKQQGTFRTQTGHPPRRKATRLINTPCFADAWPAADPRRLIVVVESLKFHLRRRDKVLPPKKSPVQRLIEHHTPPCRTLARGDR